MYFFNCRDLESHLAANDKRFHEVKYFCVIDEDEKDDEYLFFL